jgi:hypothetical protein
MIQPINTIIEQILADYSIVEIIVSDTLQRLQHDYTTALKDHRDKTPKARRV